MRPHKNTINKQLELVGDNCENVLLLGVTQELARAFSIVTAVDREPKMIEHIWPGDDATHRAILGDWFTVDLPLNSFSAVVGDGSFNMVLFPFDAKALMIRLLELMKPGGIAAVRLFTRPEYAVTEEDVIEKSTQFSWHAFRCYFNMYISSTYGTNIPSRMMLQEFNRIFPNRQQLCDITGWRIDDIANSMDAYKTSNTMTSYPTQQQWLDSVPADADDIRLISVDGYELSKYYPILTFRKPQ
jgi:hypothetical protein